MQVYSPDNWVVLEFTGAGLEAPLRKVLAGWFGGFTQANSWKINSGITEIRREGELWDIEGYTGSVYRVHTNNYRMNMLMENIYNDLQSQAVERGDITIRILTLDELR